MDAAIVRRVLASSLAVAPLLLLPSPAAAQSFSLGAPPSFGTPFGSGPLAYSGSDAVLVHILGSGQLYAESNNGWQPVCAVPCTTTVDPRLSYKLGGLLLRDSSTFQFPAGPRRLELVAKPASSLDLGNSILAWMLIGLSPAAIAPGALFAGGTFDDGGKPSTTDRVIGGALIAGGVVMISVGVYLLLSPSSTTLETADGQRIASSPEGRPRTGGLHFTPSGFVF